MSITLLDVYTIAGLLPYSKPIEELENADAPLAPEFILAYWKFINQFRSSSSPISHHEHVAFLLY